MSINIHSHIFFFQFWKTCGGFLILYITIWSWKIFQNKKKGFNWYEKLQEEHIIPELVTWHWTCWLCLGLGYRSCNTLYIHMLLMQFHHCSWWYLETHRLKAEDTNYLFSIFVDFKQERRKFHLLISGICLSLQLAFFPSWPQNS